MSESHNDCINGLAEQSRIIVRKDTEIEERNILLGRQKVYINKMEKDLTVKNEALTVMQLSIKPQGYQVWYGLFTALIGARDVHHSRIELNHLADKADVAAEEFWKRFDKDGCNVKSKHV